MTEAEWLTATDSTLMVDFIQNSGSARKLRLFLVACARLVWDRMPVDDARQAVELAERYADGLASEDERDRISKRLWSLPLAGQAAGSYAVAVSSGATQHQFKDREGDYWAYLCAQLAVHRSATWRITSRATWYGARIATGAEQPRLLRDIFGNPFRPIQMEPGWVTADIIARATQMYDARDFGAMPILADALQDAGCDCEDILGHCRDPHATHVRGCRVLDLVMGKE
jgi:hypothetical protein